MASRKKFYLVKHTIVRDNLDLFVISESWLDPSTTNNDIQIPGYVIFRQDRGPHKSGGGIVVYGRNTLKASIINNLSTTTDANSQQLWLKVQRRKSKSFVLCAAYRPDSESTSRFLDDFSASFMNSLLLDREVLVSGDLNSDVLPGSSCPEGRALMDLCVSFNLSQPVTQPTRTTDTSMTLTDFALATNKSLIASCDVIISAVADHCLVAVTLKLKAPKPRPSYSFTRSYKNYNPELFLSDLKCVPFHIVDIFDDSMYSISMYSMSYSSTRCLNMHQLNA